MSINVSTSLLKHATYLKLSMDIATFTDKQLKNIVKQVSTGSISTGNSATSRLAREIAHKMDSPFVSHDDWKVSFKELEPTSPLYDAIEQAVALSKLEVRGTDWYKSQMASALTLVENKAPAGTVHIYFMPKECKKLVRDSAKATVPSDHNVHAYLAKILNREIGTIELDLT